MGMVARFLWVVCSSSKKVICSLVAVCPYFMVNGSHPVCAEGWVEQGVSCSTPALSLFLVAPLTIGKFVAPPRSSFAVVKFHFGIMLGTPSFLLCGLLGLLDHRKPLEQRF